MTKIKILIDQFDTELDTAQEKKIGRLEDRSVENRLKNQGEKNQGGNKKRQKIQKSCQQFIDFILVYFLGSHDYIT